MANAPTPPPGHAGARRHLRSDAGAATQITGGGVAARAVKSFQINWPWSSIHMSDVRSAQLLDMSVLHRVHTTTRGSFLALSLSRLSRRRSKSSGQASGGWPPVLKNHLRVRLEIFAPPSQAEIKSCLGRALGSAACIRLGGSPLICHSARCQPRRERPNRTHLISHLFREAGSGLDRKRRKDGDRPKGGAAISVREVVRSASCRF